MPEPEHLKMVQDVISRLAGNSSQLKRWTVTLMAALLGLAASGSEWRFALIAVYVLVALAVLDAYYLALERSYRDLYREVVSRPRSMAWKMNASPVTAKDVARAVGSPSVYLLYGASLVAAVGLLMASAV